MLANGFVAAIFLDCRQSLQQLVQGSSNVDQAIFHCASAQLLPNRQWPLLYVLPGITRQSRETDLSVCYGRPHFIHPEPV